MCSLIPQGNSLGAEAVPVENSPAGKVIPDLTTAPSSRLLGL